MDSVSAELTRYKMFINGQWVDAASGQFFESLNPFTGQAWALIPDGQEQDVDRAVEAARAAMDNPDWKRMPPMQRGHLLRRFADLLRDNAEHLGRADCESRQGCGAPNAPLRNRVGRHQTEYCWKQGLRSCMKPPLFTSRLASSTASM